MERNDRGCGVRFLTSSDEFTDAILAKLDGATSVAISTFGLYCGVLHDGRDTAEWGSSYANNSRKILDGLAAVPQVRILVGLPQYKTCKVNKTQCLDCEMAYAKSLLRISAHITKFSKFKWRVCNQLHMKCTIVTAGDTICSFVGGRNYTGSDWDDLDLELDHTESLGILKLYSAIWKQAVVPSDTQFGLLLQDQGISEAAINQICGNSNF